MFLNRNVLVVVENKQSEELSSIKDPEFISNVYSTDRLK